MTTSAERDTDVLTLLLESRTVIEPAVQEFLEASRHIESWTAAGLAKDVATLRTFGPHIYEALLALDVIIGAATKVRAAALEVGARNRLGERAAN